MSKCKVSQSSLSSCICTFLFFFLFYFFHPRNGAYVSDLIQRGRLKKGIGEKVAFSLLTLFRNYQGTKRGEITVLVGLDPVHKESGSSVKGRTKISKNGNCHVRKMLYLPTLSAIRNNRQIAMFYQRLISNHKPKKLAVNQTVSKFPHNGG